MEKTVPVQSLTQKFSQLQDIDLYQQLNWTGTFEDYLQILLKEPNIFRGAHAYLRDMILHYGSSSYSELRENLVHYNFFDDPFDGGKDAIFGLDKTLMRLVDLLNAGANRYGIERRILLLQGPVGTAKSTIVRLMKKGLESYSHTDVGRAYTFQWNPDPDDEPDGMVCPMHEEPLHLVPHELRPAVQEALGLAVSIQGDLCPACQFIYDRRLERVGGDWSRVVESVKITRLLFSEKRRVGIGTFQPRDEKNQDSTELTGDINYRKIAIYGSDADPRAFDFSGELNKANRGLCEFVEILKLEVAFLYDLLTASQEKKIKPKKFPHTDVDELIIGHSVAGATPIPVRINGHMEWTTLEKLYDRFNADIQGLEVLAFDLDRGLVKWVETRAVIRHHFSGNMLLTSQRKGIVETTPNHSLYDVYGHVFYPEDRREVLAVRALPDTVSSSKISIFDEEKGYCRSDVKKTNSDAPNPMMTKPPQLGYMRLLDARFDTAIKCDYSLPEDGQDLKDLLTVLAWYITEGHTYTYSGAWGIVISQKDKMPLERVKVAFEHICTGKGHLAEYDVWRLSFGQKLAYQLFGDLCGVHSENKHLPNFVFDLPVEFQEHVFNELQLGDGTDYTPPTVTDSYREKYFEYKTTSPILAAQVGWLATALGKNYHVYRSDGTNKAAFRIRYVDGEKYCKPFILGQHAHLSSRNAEDEWVYDIECVGLHNFVCGIGCVVAHNTNRAEYNRLIGNEFMEALRDRTVRIDIPYNLRLQEEIKIYARDYGTDVVKNKHIAPHTLEVAAMWAILSRLEDPKHAGLTLIQKMKLYDGKHLPGFTEDSIIEIKSEHPDEGNLGISPRYIQDTLANILVNADGIACVNPFMLLRELERHLHYHSLITDEKLRRRYTDLLAEVIKEYDEILRNEVQRAVVADEAAIVRLCGNYIDNLKAYLEKKKVRNPITGKDEPPNERLMRAIEEKIEVPESRKDDFRREMFQFIAGLALEGKQFDWKANDQLRRALELKLFDDQKDSIKLSALVSQTVDDDTQKKIDTIKARMIEQLGYCQHCATDILNYVSSIYARGEAKNA